MNIQDSKPNPFGHNAWGYLHQKLVDKTIPRGRHLDYGAHDGRLIKTLYAEGLIDSAVGLELSSSAILKSDICEKNVQLVKIESRPKINQQYGLFDSASIIGVLEHVADQDYILKELHGCLKNGGKLLVAVPGKHLFSFLDMGNWKFVFPGLHKLFFERKMGVEAYRLAYLENPDGLIGDVEKEKGWHQHFSKLQLRVLLEKNGFEFIDSGGAGFFMRILRNLRFFSPKFLKHYIDWLVEADERIFSSAEIWILVRKV